MYFSTFLLISFLFQFEPTIKEENVGVVHHIILYGCYGDIPENAHTHEWDCANERMPDDYNSGSYHCEASLFGWAVGGEVSQAPSFSGDLSLTFNRALSKFIIFIS